MAKWQYFYVYEENSPGRCRLNTIDNEISIERYDEESYTQYFNNIGTSGWELVCTVSLGFNHASDSVRLRHIFKQPVSE